jgi:hypothetical protein
MPIKGLAIGGSSTWDRALTERMWCSRKREIVSEEKFITITNGSLSEVNSFRAIDDTTTKNGYYAQIAGFAIPNKLQFVLKYDVYDANTDKDENYFYIYTIGANYMPNQWAKLQVAYDIRKEEAEAQTKNDQIQVMLQLAF